MVLVEKFSQRNRIGKRRFPLPAPVNFIWNGIERPSAARIKYRKVEHSGHATNLPEQHSFLGVRRDNFAAWYGDRAFLYALKDGGIGLVTGIGAGIFAMVTKDYNPVLFAATGAFMGKKLFDAVNDYAWMNTAPLLKR